PSVLVHSVPTAEFKPAAVSEPKQAAQPKTTTVPEWLPPLFPVPSPVEMSSRDIVLPLETREDVIQMPEGFTPMNLAAIYYGDETRYGEIYAATMKRFGRPTSETDPAADSWKPQSGSEVVIPAARNAY